MSSNKRVDEKCFFVTVNGVERIYAGVDVDILANGILVLHSEIGGHLVAAFPDGVWEAVERAAENHEN